jgi:hypothetical protein
LALVDTGFHLCVGSINFPAVLGAALANLGAHAAGACMKSGTSEHKIGASLANLRAILKQADVIQGGMFATHAQAVNLGLHTYLMAVLTILNTLLHLFIHLPGTCVLHDLLPFSQTATDHKGYVAARFMPVLMKKKSPPIIVGDANNTR